MKNARNKLLTNAIGHIMRPLVPVLLRHGIAYKRLEEIVRTAYVDEAIARLGNGAKGFVARAENPNDAAALAAADVGVGVHGGAEAVLAAADVFLGKPGLSPVVDLLHGAERTLGVIRRNLVFSLAYNVAAVTLAMTGHMHPLLAAILMPLSSITVVVLATFLTGVAARRAGVR